MDLKSIAAEPDSDYSEIEISQPYLNIQPTEGRGR